MERFLLRIFQREVALQCKILLEAGNELAKVRLRRDPDKAWRHLQEILVAAANLSKMFWGSRGKHEAARTALRKSLGVADDSPIRDVNLRNDFEHFDDRLETWFERDQNHVYVGRNIGPYDKTIRGDDPSNRFQHYDPDTFTVTFWDNTVSLVEIIEEVTRISRLAERESSKPHWE